MRSFALALAAAGCMTTRTVPKSQLGAVASRNVSDGVVLRTTGIWKTRLDPTSKIRFSNAAGKWSDWLDGDKLYVADRGVYTPATIDPLDYATRIEIRGMAEVERDALSTSRPAQGTEPVIDIDGTAILTAHGEALHRWIESFFEVMRTMHDYNDLRYGLHGKPLGRWTLHVPDREPLVLEGEMLYARLDDGLHTRYGWRWNEIQAAEVKSLSGSLTLTAIVGVTALSIALVPVALFARGGFPFPGDGPRAGSSGGGAGDALGHIGGGGGGRLPRGDWAPTLADEKAMSALTLFGAGARRKAIIQIAASAEASIGTVGGHPLLDGGAAVMRIRECFVLGAGGLHVATRNEDQIWNGGLAFARIGAHLPFDAAHRVAAPLSIDLGGGGGEAVGVFARLNWGLRFALPHQAFVGVAPASPTLINWKHDPTRRRASLMSGVELLGITW